MHCDFWAKPDYFYFKKVKKKKKFYDGLRSVIISKGLPISESYLIGTA